MITGPRNSSTLQKHLRHDKLQARQKKELTFTKGKQEHSCLPATVSFTQSSFSFTAAKTSDFITKGSINS